LAQPKAQGVDLVGPNGLLNQLAEGWQAHLGHDDVDATLR
jgi:hypothetical protein